MTDLHPPTDLSDDPATTLPSAQPGRRDPERGFSLIELIIVIVIIGILVAIAIPVYNNIQDNAKQNAADAAAANGASQAAAKIANGATTATEIDLSKLDKGDLTLSITPSSGLTLDNYCVTAEGNGHTGTAGPACPGSTSAPSS